MGNLYGTTFGGGGPNFGTVFELSQAATGWNESLIYVFGSNPYDGRNPEAGLVFDSASNLYGSTGYGGQLDGGGGTIFKLSMGQGKWSESILHAFPTNDKDGFFLLAGVALDSHGNVYGATVQGPTSHPASCASGLGCGTVLKLVPGSDGSWVESLRYVFPRFAQVVGVISDASGNLYATEQIGDAIFELSPTSTGWNPKWLYSFTGGADGRQPQGSLALDSAGNLYGVTFYGGQYGYGTVFEITP